jgi:hypothetical protein
MDAMVPYYWFDPGVIFIASGWRCYLCGTETPKVLSGRNHPQALQLDNVVPLSRRGPHTPENCANICRRGNGLKRYRVLEERKWGLHPLGWPRL